MDSLRFAPNCDVVIYARFDELRLRASESILTGDDVNGHINSLGHEPHHYAIFYVMVDDVAAALTKAVSLGGKKLVGPGAA